MYDQTQTPEQQIEARLQNAMQHLAAELNAQGVDMNSLNAAFTVTWQNGTPTVTPVESAPTPAPKTRGKGES